MRSTAADQTQLQHRQRGRQQGQRRQQEERRQEQLLDLRLALITPDILVNAQAGRHTDIVEHITELRWNTIAVKLVAFARAEAADRALMETHTAHPGPQQASVRRTLLICTSPAENHAVYAEL